MASPSADLFAPAVELLHDLLAVSLTAVDLMRPIYSPDGTELVDFTVEYLNPAAQRIMGLPERPNVTARARFPELFANGVFAFYRRVFETGEAGRYDFLYQADGFDHYFHVAARRSGELLVVSCTDTADQPHTPAENALREAQAAETALQAPLLAAARQQAQQREAFYQVLEQTQVVMALLRGPTHRFEYVNPAYQAFNPGRQLVGLDLAVATPEVVEPGFIALVDHVYHTGETFFGAEDITSVPNF